MKEGSKMLYLNFHVEASNFSELKRKALEALDLAESEEGVTLSQYSDKKYPSLRAAVDDIAHGLTTPYKRPESPMAAMAEAAAPKATRTRRTKEEIEAERRLKNETAKTAGEKIENNFEAADEIAATEITTAKVNPLDEDAPMITFQDCKDALKKVMDTKDMDTAIALIGTFGVAKITALPEEKYPAFMAACKKALS